MPSQNKLLYDEIKQDWFSIALTSDIQDLISDMNNKELQLIPSQQGSRGLRYFNNKLEYSNDNGVTWTEIQTGGGVSLPISGDDVTDTTSRVLITPQQRGQIDSNASDINSHSQRISTLEQSIGNITSTDEKVKMNSTDTSGYLSDKLDGTTIQNINNKIVATGLDGLTTTIYELNLLSGATANIQTQINALTNVGNFSTSVDTHADLTSLTPQVNDMVIVIHDETQVDFPTSIYIFNGTVWVYSGKFEGGQIRDFITNPINLDNETTGLLPKLKYEKQNASETPITDASGNLVATNVEDALAELFTYANNLKSIATVIGSPLSTSDTSAQLNTKMQQLKVLFASYLTQKGAIAYPYNTVEEMINKILTIPNITLEGAVKKISKLNITAPYELRIPLDEPIPLTDITTTPFEFLQGATGIVHYNVGFDNGDASDFELNNNIEFDGVMKLKTDYDFDMTKDTSWTSEGELHRKKITRDDWLRIDKLNVLYKN